VELGADAKDIAAGQVKVCIGGEGSSDDLRRRGGLERVEPLSEARRAIVRRGVETKDGCEGTAMDDALAGVATRLEAQRIDVRPPDAGHIAFGQSRLAERHASARDPLATSLRNATPDATPSANQNTALQTVVAIRKWLCNSAGANDDSTAG
jgi:hypothetical protein